MDYPTYKKLVNLLKIVAIKADTEQTLREDAVNLLVDIIENEKTLDEVKINNSLSITDNQFRDVQLEYFKGNKIMAIKVLRDISKDKGHELSLKEAKFFVDNCIETKNEK